MTGDDLGFIHAYESGSDGALLLLHGTGGNETDLVPLGRMIAPGATLISPRGKVLENGMPRYFRRLAEGVFDLEDLKFRTGELLDFIQRAEETYSIEPGSMTVVGYSNGANIAASLLLSGPSPFRKAILLRAMVPFETDSPPDLSGVSILVNAGRNDPLIPASGTERLVEVLRSAGADVDLQWPAPSHGLTREDIETAKRWLG